MIRFAHSRMTRILLSLVLLTALIIGQFALTACAAKAERPLLKFGDGGWDSFRLHNAIAGYILQHGYDVDWEQVTGGTAITWKALMEGDIQVYMETFSENIATYPDDVASGRVIELGVNYDDNAQGVYVPRYVIEGDPARGIAPMAPDLKTVKDLAKYPDVFADPEQPEKGRLYGSVAGWEADEILNRKYVAYGLDKTFTYFRAGSEAGQTAALVDAYKKGQAWAGYYWEPNWISAQYDIVCLDDEPYKGDKAQFQAGLTAFPANRLTVCVHPDVAKKYPDVAAFLSRYKTSSDLVTEAMAYMHDQGLDTIPASIAFLKNHDDLLVAWVTDADRLKKVRDALAKEG